MVDGRDRIGDREQDSCQFINPCCDYVCHFTDQVKMLSNAIYDRILSTYCIFATKIPSIKLIYSVYAYILVLYSDTDECKIIFGGGVSGNNSEIYTGRRLFLDGNRFSSLR